MHCNTMRDKVTFLNEVKFQDRDTNVEEEGINSNPEEHEKGNSSSFLLL